MPATLQNILGPDGAVARRLGSRYEFRPQQLEMASSVEQAFKKGHHLLVEAGTGVGKSFAYLLPAIDYAVRMKKRVVVSTHTISLQEQLIEKDIPLLRAVYPDEFTAVLVKGRGNYLCKRRLEQTRSRQNMLFDDGRQLESLWAIEEWANETTDGSLADLPALPNPGVWDRVCAEQGNCLGKKCNFYDNCFWQAAKRRMQGGTILVVNHALFFSDLALRMAGVNYLPKYDAVILDEAHTLEDVAGSHFGLKIGESTLRYQLRLLYDNRRGKGMLSTHGTCATPAIRDIQALEEPIDEFFEGCVQWQQSSGRTNGRIHEPHIVPNDLSPRLRDLSLHLKEMLPSLQKEEELSELTSAADKISDLAIKLDAVMGHTIPDAVYWMETAGQTERKVTLNAAPINIAEGLRMHLFEQVRSVVVTSATLCTSSKGTTGPQRGTGFQPVREARSSQSVQVRQGANLPHWTKDGAIYAITFRLADSIPTSVLQSWRAERDEITERAATANRQLTSEESERLKYLESDALEEYLDAGHGACWLKSDAIANVVADALKFFDGKRYDLLSWSVMPNHVHVVTRPRIGFELPAILHSWKRFTANDCNKRLNRTGEFWQSEYYDHIIRDEDDLRNQVEYVWRNAEKAGFPEWKWRALNDSMVASILNGAESGSQHGLKTHATVQNPGFDYIKSRLGVAECETLQLGSPFDYATQATLFLETDLPEPNDTNRFMPAACDRILHYLLKTNGGAFVLFTSYKMLIDAANRLKEDLERNNLPLLVQGQQAPRKVLLDRFRATPNAVLFGTSSFWQGIDVQGDALRNVIIVKLPFAVPDEPVIEARLDAIKRAGGNAFMEYSVPEAIIKLKQGFGRLIRSRTDTGIVVILDSRIKTKRYGKLFLEALPECRTGEL